ncbi:hypothetical protein DUNSADRAFT_14163 [Dunaliella salina]|uniref:Uncharacterized protein n=1 Tax=Dunaliella salina TaxID=3046 RepID=A0ABQ7H2S4_DUNSA|nr:hypothetical protein DUNSADRAFT_14163 [Dunaliella salina]|eukprot:KAF5841160.1 hypothetical protein DUNSADRAFT_14163 [Dunaliella salina]
MVHSRTQNLGSSGPCIIWMQSNPTLAMGDPAFAMVLVPLAQQLCSAAQEVVRTDTAAAEVRFQEAVQELSLLHAQQLETTVAPMQAKLEDALLRCAELEGCVASQAEEHASARAMLEAEALAMGERAAGVQADYNRLEAQLLAQRSHEAELQGQVTALQTQLAGGQAANIEQFEDMAAQGTKDEAGWLWHRTKAHKLQVFLLLMVAVAGLISQNILSVEMLWQYQDKILLMLLVLAAVVWLIDAWHDGRANPCEPTSKSKKEERA